MKTFSRLLVVSAALAAVASAQAVIIHVQGSSTHSFSFAAGSPTDLTFADGAFSFNMETDGNRVGLSDTDLGIFSLGNSTGDFNGTFDLTVSFTLPTTTPGGTMFHANLSGHVGSVNGAAVITFESPLSQSFSYLTADGVKGTLVLDIDGGPYTVRKGRSNDLSGGLTATAVPGPAALASFGVGALGMVRRRRAAKK